MKVKQVYIWADHSTGVLKARATVDVAGLGDVQFEAVLSDETIDRVRVETETALRVRLGQKLEPTL